MKPLLTRIFLSRDFYSPSSLGAQIKSPVQLAVSTYRKLELTEGVGVGASTGVGGAEETSYEARA